MCCISGACNNANEGLVVARGVSSPQISADIFEQHRTRGWIVIVMNIRGTLMRHK